MKKSSNEQRRRAARPRFYQRSLLCFRPRVRLILKRARTRESSHKQRRGAAVVFGPEGSQAFDFWSATRNLEAISHEEEFARATPWCRSGVRARRKSSF
jgi:hypothetical protein